MSRTSTGLGSGDSGRQVLTTGGIQPGKPPSAAPGLELDAAIAEGGCAALDRSAALMARRRQ
jgi:hypothetical protein